MKLAELEPRFFRVEVKRKVGEFVKSEVSPHVLGEVYTEDELEKREYDAMYTHTVELLADADGVEFFDPAQFREKHGTVGCCKLHIPFLDKAQAYPGPHWVATGTCLEDLTLSPSILVQGPGIAWHGFVRNGEIFDV